ncbi:AraC family transcriptional regulator [Undibacterium sp. CY18W]|uniref:AraC family transcriptional regulator n=1 Tax=Undibacterium hunanense TaxID=2762292 RepID=A0ABR6ZQ38_9BURK|nr:helix-turn-helix domain-containing protein [Undibacterium hunanense]MBC3918022.1 AraC family transcriptional regulator [Undibacterium hunanense]
MPFTEPLMLLDAGLRGTLIALLLLLSAILWRDRPRLTVVRTGIALCLGLAVQVFAATPLFEAMVPRIWQAPLVAVSVANAVMFWIFVQALFDDDFVLRPLHIVLWLVVAVLSGLNCAVVAGSSSILTPLLLGIQRGVPLLFAALAALAAARQWRTDLVEQRRRLRAFIVITGIAYTVILLAARLGSPHGRLMGPTATADVLILLLIIATVTVKMLKLGNLDLFPAPRQQALPVSGQLDQLDMVPADEPLSPGYPPISPTPRAVEHDPAEERLAIRLQDLMKQERLYRSEELSLASLAARLQLPEYRLRRLINQRLGYRNFNAYINEFRLTEARTALKDPALRDLPVLSIALEAGFQSIGPFNRAFKAATGLTPTEFRKENMADS